ncbi:MAG: hypothetical protein U0165_00455 [Polyangiaceae bacterium]
MLTKGQYRLVGQKGEWSSIQAATGLNGKLYTVDGSGYLACIDPQAESIKKLSAQSGWASKFMVNAYSRIFDIESSGTVYSIDAEDGSYAKVSNDGQWGTAKAVTTSRGRLLIRDENGKLYELDPWTKEYREIGTSTWTSSWLVEGGTDTLVSIESSGTIYRINTKTGNYDKVGKDNEWEGSLAVAGRGGSLFIFSSTGTVYSVNIWDGSYVQIGESTGWSPKFAVMGDYYLYTFENDGSLYEIAVY